METIGEKLVWVSHVFGLFVFESHVFHAVQVKNEVITGTFTGQHFDLEEE